MLKSSISLILVLWGQITFFVKISNFGQFFGHEFFSYKSIAKIDLAKGHKKSHSTILRKSLMVISGFRKKAKNLSKIKFSFSWLLILRGKFQSTKNISFFDFSKFRLMLFGCCMAALLS